MQIKAWQTTYHDSGDPKEYFDTTCQLLPKMFNRTSILNFCRLTIIFKISFFPTLVQKINRWPNPCSHHQSVTTTPHVLSQNMLKSPISPLPLGMHTDALSELVTKLLVSIGFISTGGPDPRTPNLHMHTYTHTHIHTHTHTCPLLTRATQ